MEAEPTSARSGIGRYALDAITAKDYNAVQGFVVFAALLYVLVFLAIDLLYPLLDPRVRVG